VNFFVGGNIFKDLSAGGTGVSRGEAHPCLPGAASDCFVASDQLFQSLLLFSQNSMVSNWFTEFQYKRNTWILGESVFTKSYKEPKNDFFCIQRAYLERQAVGGEPLQLWQSHWVE